MRKPISFVTFLAVGVFCLNGCDNPVNDDDANLVYQSYGFTDLSGVYTIDEDTSIIAYTYEGKETIYVSLLDMLDGLGNLFNDYTYSINSLSNNITMKRGSYKCVIDWEKNTLTSVGYSFYYFIRDVGGVNYSHHLKSIEAKGTEEEEIVLDLSAYDMDILYWSGLVLLPFPVFNSLFCSLGGYNIFFNGYGFYGVSGESWINNADQYNTIKNSSLSGTSCSDEIRELTINHFAWFMDAFYGLNDVAGISSFKNLITDDWLSNDASVFTTAYYRLFFGTLDEGHTGIDASSCYNDISAKYTSSDYYGARRNSIYSTRAELLAMQNKTYEEGRPMLEMQEDSKTAIVHFDSFSTIDSSVVDEEDEESIYKYASSDTYYLFRYAMNEITKQGNIENIVLDISTNGGGNVGAMARALGFLTNENVTTSSHNSLSNQYAYYTRRVDTNGDGSYDDNDGYPQYNWYILTSNYTYSAANIFAATAKNEGIATLIGEVTGGGMCSVLTSSMADGTFFRFSSPNGYCTMKQLENGSYRFTTLEYGVNPDYSMDREYFYDYEYIDEFVSSISNGTNN